MRKTQRAYTAIEMVTAIAILVVLVGLAVGRYSPAWVSVGHHPSCLYSEKFFYPLIIDAMGKIPTDLRLAAQIRRFTNRAYRIGQ